MPEITAAHSPVVSASYGSNVGDQFDQLWPGEFLELRVRVPVPPDDEQGRVQGEQELVNESKRDGVEHDGPADADPDSMAQPVQQAMPLRGRNP